MVATVAYAAVAAAATAATVVVIYPYDTLEIFVCRIQACVVSLFVFIFR